MHGASYKSRDHAFLPEGPDDFAGWCLVIAGSQQQLLSVCSCLDMAAADCSH